MDALGENCVGMLSDGGSIPLTSTKWTLHEHLLFQRRLCRKGLVVMPTK